VETSAANHHPRMGEVTLPEGCVSAGGADVVLRVATAASDRESYVRTDGTTAREGLRLSFFATVVLLAVRLGRASQASATSSASTSTTLAAAATT